MSQRLNITSKAPLLSIDGFLIHQLCGAEGEGNGTGEGQGGNGNGGTGSGDGGQNGGNGTQSGGGTGQGNGSQSGTGDPQVTRAEFDALFARMQAADQAKSKAEAKLAEHENKGKSDLEKAQADLAAANARIAELEKGRDDMLTSNAFLTAKDLPTFHSNATAMQLLDRSLLTIDGGKVTGMAAAVDKLKKDHPYLIKSDAGAGNGGSGGKGGSGAGNSGGGSGSGSSGGQGGGQATGSSNNGGGGGGKTVDKEKLAKKFPALRGR